MKRFVTAVIAFAFAFAFALCLVPEDAHAASNFTIEDYDIQVVVNEDDTYSVTETIDVHFTAPSHGIYRTIPLRTRLDRDGQVTSYFASVDDFTMLSGQQWEKDSSGDAFSAKIGDPDVYADTDTVYKLRYTYDTKGDHFKNGDEVYFNLIGTNWEAQSIDHVSFHITFPKSIDMNKVGVKTGSDEYISFEAVSDTEIKGETSSYVLNGLTIRAVLPEGYFTRQAKSPDLFLYILIAIMALITIIGYFFWRKYGRDPHIVETEEFYPPANLSAPEVGYLADGDISGEHIISTLLSLADRGYLKISEIQEPTGFRKKKTKKSYEITKLRDYEEDVIGEAAFMDGLFSIGDSVSISDLKNKFYKTVGEIKSEIEKHYKGKLYDKKAGHCARILRIAGSVGIIAIILVSTFIGGSLRIMFSETVIGTLFFMMLSFITLYIGFYGIANKINNPKGLLGIVGFAVCILVGLFFCLLFDIAGGVKFIPFLVGMAMCFILFLMAALCERKTDWYAQVLGKIRGYKRFLEVAEKDKMEALAEEDPQYFYKNLAFAFALGVTAVYAKHFASLATRPPEWYESPYIYGSAADTNWAESAGSLSFLDSLDSMMDSISGSMTSSPSDGGGGGSFSGGGGGGGGGGGSW